MIIRPYQRIDQHGMMDYRAVNHRCAVDISTLQLPISEESALAILNEKGFKIVEVNLLKLARECIGTSRYQRGANPQLAPQLVDCSSFTKWLYAQRGIWLPRRSIQQRELGEVVALHEVTIGDLVFRSGWIDYYRTDPSDGVGHVGIATGTGTVIHAANKKAGVIETSLEEFALRTFRGARRYIPSGSRVFTLETPATRCIETADDIRWVVLQTPKRMTKE